MKALKIIIASSFLMLGTNAFANTNADDCSQVNSGHSITRDDAYTNPQTTTMVKAALDETRPATVRQTGGANEVTD